MKSKNAGIIIFICIIAAALAVAILSVVSMKFSVKTPAKIISSEYIAHVQISGIIQASNRTYNQKWLLDTIHKLRTDKKNVGIMLSIDSPGGAVYETDEVYLALREYADGGKPVWAYLEQMAASGGYYMACGADYIVANRNTLTGSIGVIAGQSVDLTGLMEHYGIKVTTITAGKNKNMMGFDSPLTPEQRAIMQSVADECYDQFVEIVAEARGISSREAQKLADGRIYTAKQALDAGLIDDVAAFADALTWFYEDFLEDNPARKLETIDFKYTPRSTFTDFITAKFRLIPELEALNVLPEVRFPAYLYVQ
jgi:protease-4